MPMARHFDHFFGIFGNKKAICKRMLQADGKTL
jgi:hypothetical protein